MATRRSTRLSTSAPTLPTATPSSPHPLQPAPSRKRPLAATPLTSTFSSTKPLKRSKSAKPAPSPEPERPLLPEKASVLVHPPLTFSYAEARAHIEATDPRWKPLMDRLRCKPYEGEQDRPFNPFMSLVTSLIGQQISWLAARSVQHKFTKLFFPDLPDLAPHKQAKESGDYFAKPTFPTPWQVLALPDAPAALRAAGLSNQKASYVLDLARRFADGRLDAEWMWRANEEELYAALIAVRGVGPWTIHMFEQFSARRPDVLAVGDLGLQKGLLIWYTTPVDAPPPVKAEKMAKVPATPAAAVATDSPAQSAPTTPPPATNAANATAAYPTPATPGLSLDTVPPAATHGGKLSKTDAGLPPLPAGSSLTHAALRSRLAGNKVKGGMYLTAKEMEELAEPWRPYRSVAMWYMWALVDG